MSAGQSAALFLFAHQDDEFGVFQKIIDEQGGGNRVFCVYLTDGVFEGKSSRRRNRESVAVLTRLGVQEDDIFFAGHTLSIPDGGLPDHMSSATEWLKNWLGAGRSMAAIYVPAWEGGHQDHDALHAVAVMAARMTGLMKIVRQFPLYNGYKCSGPLFRVLLPLPENGTVDAVKVSWPSRLRFLRYCLAYPSQTISWIGLFPFVLLHYIFHGTQSLQAVSLERIRQRPHAGPLYYERRHFFTWEQMSNRLSESANIGGKTD